MLAVAPPDPRAFITASISSNTMMCNLLLSPRCLASFSASSNNMRTFSSLCPTNFCKISGPFTIFGGCAFNIFPSCRATNVFPVPGGPYSSTPRTCCNPSRLATSLFTILDANTRRKMSPNCLSKPPTPCSTNELPSSNMRAKCACEDDLASSATSGVVFPAPAAGPVFFSSTFVPGGAAARTAGFGFGFSMPALDGARGTFPVAGTPNAAYERSDVTLS
mmetsp:Transcript_7496/g.16751  ORF Transcript_7496/g.16751 Transcript_7496/m.16751 type:complete len:220 (-) Transcript_7496:157-816(-)